MSVAEIRSQLDVYGANCCPWAVLSEAVLFAVVLVPTRTCKLWNVICRCVVTKSSYTEEEDFSKADAVFDCIGEAGQERFSFADLIGDVDVLSERQKQLAT